MKQTARSLTDNVDNTAVNAFSEYFQFVGERHPEEALLLGQVIGSILTSGTLLNNKSIIAKLVYLLESTDDVVSGDVIRKTLEIVMDNTTDDL